VLAARLDSLTEFHAKIAARTIQTKTTKRQVILGIDEEREGKSYMRLTIIAGLIMGLALGIHSVLGSHVRTGGAQAETARPPHASRAHVHREQIYLQSTSAELGLPTTSDRVIANDATHARVRTATAIILWTVWARS